MNHEPSSISKDIGSAAGAAGAGGASAAVKTAKAELEEDDFEKAFWLSYPRRTQSSGALTRGSKIRATKEWTRMGAGLRKAALAGLEPYGRLHPDRSPGVVDAERYLRDQRWRDGEDASAGVNDGARDGAAKIDIAWPADEGERAFAQALVRRFGAARYGSWFQDGGAPLIRKNGAGFYLAASGARREMIEQRHWPALEDVAASLGAVISRVEAGKEASRGKE